MSPSAEALGRDVALTPTNSCGGKREKGALSLKFTVEVAMPLTAEPDWDLEQSCMWFEIPLKTGSVLCRIDGRCFMNSLGATSTSPMACRVAFVKFKPRIHAVALTQVEAGHLDSLPNMLRRFVWLTEKQFAS
jgi:hypothetical protein